MAVVGGPDEIVTDGLVLHLDAANPQSYPGSGTTWNDLSGNGNNVTLTNGPTFGSENAGSVEFDGVNDYGGIGPVIPLGNQFTVMAMVRLSGTNGQTSLFGSNANGQDNWFGFYLNYVRLVITETADVNNYNVFSTTELDISNTIWYHIAGTVNINTAEVYVNGIQETSATRGYTIGSWTSTFAVGRRAGLNQQYFKGSVSNLTVYDRVLSSQEIQKNYNATKERFTNK